MKRSLSLSLLFLLSIQAFTQQTIQVGSGGNMILRVPYDNQYEYNWSTVIYPKDRINLIGDISKIAYKLTSLNVYTEAAINQKVYMAHTSDLYYSVGAEYPDPASMTLVYNGPVTYHDFRISGNTEIILTAPFSYNNSDNLIIHIENHSGTKITDPDNYLYVYSEGLADYPCLYNQADGSFPASGGTRTKELPIVYLTFEAGLDAGVSSIQDDMHSAGMQEIRMKFSNYLTDEITSVDIDWEIDGSPQTTYNWTGSLLSGQETEMFAIGIHSFSAGEHTIKTWTANPNSSADEDATNDTMEVDILVVDPVFVDRDATGTYDGTSWANAYDSLHKALEAASSNSIIWVAEGTYLPTNTGDRIKSFEVPDSVWLYGGFIGTEGDLSERDIQDHPTILSGNIGAEDEVSDNSIHVVTAGNNVRLNGFTISGGNADSTCTDCTLGGGIFANGVKNVKIFNCTFENNYADVGGAINGNFCTGLIYVENCIFLNNSAKYGAAIDCHDTPSKISRSVFAGNSATEMGGAIYNWGAVSDPEITHCSFYDNTCDDGSAIHNRALGIIGSIKNSIFYGNQDPPVSLSNGAEGDTEISYSLIDQAEFTGNNNITGDPLFADTLNYNLQIMGGSPCIDAGDPGSPLDPDGTRADIGAYHFDLGNDAGVILHYSPESEFEAGVQELIVAIKNFGRNTLTEAAIVCEIDGVHFASKNWTGSLGYADTSAQISLGFHDFGFGNHSIKVWTSDPNSTTDEFNLNDTLVFQVKTCEYLEGTYTIGPSGTFGSIPEAVDSLSNMCGISGAVTFNIEPGTYNDQIVISGIRGLSESSPITFQSLSGDSNDVVLTTDSTDYLLYLDGTDYIRFRNISFTSDNAAKLVVLDSGACNNVFEGNIFSTGNGGATLVYSGTSFNDSNNLYQNNLFQDGEYGLNLYGGVSDRESSTRILNNVFSTQNSASIFLQWSDSALISGNEVQSNQYGIYIAAGYSHTIEANRVSILGSNGRNGIRISACYSDSSQSSLVKNNFISGYVISGAGLTVNSSAYQNLFHNSVKVTKGSALSLYSTSNITSKNNILVSDVGVIQWNPWDAVDFESDYNSFFTTSDNFTGNIYSMEAWQDSTSQDEHSLFFMPLFSGEEDLHTTAYLLDSAGTGLSDVDEDIDGEARNATNPDIGADEFDSPCNGLLSGLYSIGASGDFASFNDAVHALRNCGVSGDVVFTVESGNYHEQVLIEGFIPGSTEQDSITFRSGGDPESVILSWDADTLSNYTMKLDGADRIIFRNLSIQAEDSTYGRVIELSGGACHNLIEDCIITGPVSGDDNANKALVYLTGDQINPDTNNVFKGNTLINGSHGIYLKSSGETDRGKNNTLSGNEFRQQSAYGIRSDYQFNLRIKGNSIENYVLLEYPFYGISLFYNTDSVLLSGNQLKIDRDYISYGFRISANHVWIINNFISLRSESSQSAGIYGLGQQSKCYHNSVNIYGSSQSIALDITYFTGIVDIKNNIFTNHASGYAFKCKYGSTLTESDYNSLYTNGPHLGEWSQTNIPDLGTWISVTGGDEHSVSPAPGHFVSDTDLHTSFVLFDAAATPLAAVAEDIDGEVRDVATPDIGADEFSVATFSLGEDVTACLDAEHVLSAGVGFDSYLWSTGSDSSTTIVDSSGVGSGFKEISIIVSKDGTDYYDTVLVTFSSPVANPVPDYCFDHVAGEVVITAGESESYYWWSSGEGTRSITVPNCIGYTVTVTDANGCEGTGTINVHCNQCYANLNMPEDTTIALNDSIKLDGCYQCYEEEVTYTSHALLWSTGDTTKTISLKGSALGIGTYVVWIRVLNKTNGCETSDTIRVIVEDKTGFSYAAREKVLIYPNPTNRVFYVKGDNMQRISICNTKGQIIHSSRVSRNVYEVDLGKYSRGLYIVKITTRNEVLVGYVILH